MSEAVATSTATAVAAPVAPVTNIAGGAPPVVTASAAPTGTESPKPGANDWTASFDPDTKGYLENKQFKDPKAVVDSYRNIEKLLGVPKERLLKLPENMGDPAAMKEVYDRLGRPGAPTDYKIGGEGTDKNFVDFAQGAFHELGLTKGQGETLAGRYNEWVQTQVKAAQAAQGAKNEADRAVLQKEWGAAFAQNERAARDASLAFGVSKEQIDKLESAMGYGGVLKFFAAIGEKMGEASFVHGGGAVSTSQSQRALTPEAAKNRINTLKGDPDFTKRYITGDSNARAEMQRLHEMAYDAG